MRFAGFVVAFALAGCATTPVSQVAMFGTTAHEVSGKVDAVLDEYNRVALERQFTDYAAAYNGNHAHLLTSEALSGISEPITPDQKKNFAFYKANRALASYTKALAELAYAGGSREAIDRASARLFGSMVSLNDQYRILTETRADLFDKEKMGAASTLITGIGSVLVDHKRREALRGIVIQSDPAISHVCDLLITQLDEAKMEESIAASRQNILTEELVDYKTRIATTMTTLDWRREQLRRLYGLQQGVYHSKLLVQQAKNAIMEVKSTHAVLARDLAENRFSSREMAAAVGRLVELKDHYEDFHSLLLDCNKVTRNSQGVFSCDDK